MGYTYRYKKCHPADVIVESDITVDSINQVFADWLSGFANYSNNDKPSVKIAIICAKNSNDALGLYTLLTDTLITPIPILDHYVPSIELEGCLTNDDNDFTKNHFDNHSKINPAIAAMNWINTQELRCIGYCNFQNVAEDTFGKLNEIINDLCRFQILLPILSHIHTKGDGRTDVAFWDAFHKLSYQMSISEGAYRNKDLKDIKQTLSECITSTVAYRSKTEVFCCPEHFRFVLCLPFAAYDSVCSGVDERYLPFVDRIIQIQTTAEKKLALLEELKAIAQLTEIQTSQHSLAKHFNLPTVEDIDYIIKSK